MASRRPTTSVPQEPGLTVEQRRLCIARIETCIRDLEAFDPQAVKKRYRIAEVMALEASIADALSAAFGYRTPTYNRYSTATTLDNGPHVARMSNDFGLGPEPDYDGEDARVARKYLAEGKEQSIALLRQAIRTLHTEIDYLSAGATQTSLPKSVASSRKIFVVHGRDDGPREAVARFLERLGFEAIILHERANQSRTVVEKIEANSDVGFAVVLLTPDDEGNLKGEPPQPRARQNVLLELGYFIGKLTRSRVCTLKVGDVEIPSDWRGVVDEPFDENGGWKQTLARELEAAEYDIDWNTVMRP